MSVGSWKCDPVIGVEMEIGSTPAVDLQLLNEDTARDLGTVTRAGAAASGGSSFFDGADTADDAALQMTVSFEQGTRSIAVKPAINMGRLSRLFPNSIHTTDLKHIVDNLLHECLDSMSLWPMVLEGMRALEKLLRGPLMRERFQATCFQEQDPDRKLFDTWSVSLKSLRWRCVTEFTFGVAQA